MCLAASYWRSKLFYIRLWFVTNTNVEAILTHAYRSWWSNLLAWQLPLNPKCCSASYLQSYLRSRCPVRISAGTSIERSFYCFFFSSTSTTNPPTSFKILLNTHPLTDACDLKTPTTYNLMFFWPCIMDWLTLITNLMHWLLFIHKILFSSTCFEHQVLIFRRT